jgi:hypothetical protein
MVDPMVTNDCNENFDYNMVRRRCEEAMRIMKNPDLLKTIAILLNVSLELPRREKRKYLQIQRSEQ